MREEKLSKPPEVLETVEFRLPLPPARGNIRGSDIIRWRSEREWQTFCMVAFRNQGLYWPKTPWSKTRVSLMFVLPRGSIEDHDNVIARRKAIIDWLKVHWAKYDPQSRFKRQPLSRPPADPTARDVFVEKPGFFIDDDPSHVELGPIEIVLMEPGTVGRNTDGCAVKLERLA